MRPFNYTTSTIAHHHPNSNGFPTHVESSRISIPVDPSLPHWLFDPKSLPPIYHQVIGAVSNNFGLDSSIIYKVFLTSGLSKPVLQHIWSLTSRTHPGWFTPAELISALALIGLAQTEQSHFLSSHRSPETLGNVLNLQRLHTLTYPPVPHVTVPFECSSNGHNSLLGPDPRSSPTSCNHPQSIAFNQQPPPQRPWSGNQPLGAQTPNGPHGNSVTTTSVSPPHLIDEDWAEFTSCKAPIENSLCRAVDPLDTIKFDFDWSGRNQTAVTKSPDAHDDEFGDFQTSDDTQHSQKSTRPIANQPCQTNSSGNPSSTYLRPNYNLSADLMSDLTPSESVQHEWLRCVVQCAELMRESLDVLELLTGDSERGEFNATEEGREFFYDILEVYLVAHRIRGSAERLALFNAPLQTRLSEITMSMSKLSQFIVNGDIRRTWDSVVTMSGQDGGSASLDALTGFMNPSSDEPLCGVCLSPVHPEQAESGPGISSSSAPWSSSSVALAGRIYHAPCANLWINRVQLSLPALVAP